jgi:methyl-accepting chemotaxis protein
VAVALAGSGSAFAILAAMLSYVVALRFVSTVLLELGTDDARHRGTVSGKIVLVSVGLVWMATVLLVCTSYVRYRHDLEQRYVDAGVAAQERAARGLAAERAEPIAELVYLASGAPTLVLHEDGAVLARVPASGTVALEGLPRGTGVEALAGGWRLRRSAGALTLVSFLPDTPLREQREGFRADASLLAAVLVLASVVLVWFATRSLTMPIRLLGNAADRIASGDLTVRPPTVSRDELGRLAADFRKMASGLATLLAEVRDASAGVNAETQGMGVIGDRVKGGAREEHERVLALRSAVEAMQSSVQLVGRGIETLTDYVHSTSTAVGQMAAALEEVRRQAVELEHHMGSADADVRKLSEAGQSAHTELGALGALAGNAKTTLASVSASLAGLETSAIASQLAAAQAAEMADHAGAVVHDTVGGIESLRSAVGDAKKRVAVLWRRSDDIDKILDFIGEVAGRTNLLSLNASIIATQAGEHGKAFAVVAEQIRELAAQISSSTKSIGQIIRAVRDDVNGTARLIDRGDALAAEGVAHARKSLGALQEIRTATAKGHETAAAIRDAVQVHALSTREVSNLVTSVAANSQSLADAIEMVGTSVAAVGSVAEGARALADEVSRALDEQSGLGRRQLASLELIDSMLSDITRAVMSHDANTRRVHEVLSALSVTAEQHEAAVVELSGVAERLGGRSRALAERVNRFKI